MSKYCLLAVGVSCGCGLERAMLDSYGHCRREDEGVSVVKNRKLVMITRHLRDEREHRISVKRAAVWEAITALLI